MCSVLLIRPLCEGGEPEFAEPLGIERLAGYLLAHGVGDVRIADRRLPERERQMGLLDADAPGFYEELRAAYARGKAPDIVGVSLMTSADVPDARRIVDRLSAWWPQARFVAGGVFVTSAPDEAARALPARMTLVRGEGEAALLAMARSRRSPQADESMGSEPVDSFSRGKGETAPLGSTGGKVTCDVSASEQHGNESISSVPIDSFGDAGGFPVLSLPPDEWAPAWRSCLERYAALGCAVNMQTSRGCPGNCAFCATPGLPSQLRRWHPRSLRLVADEIVAQARQLERAGLPPVFNFVDDDFGSLERLEELARELQARNVRVAFACEMRFASLAGQPELAQRLARLHEAGLTRVFFGVESLNPQTLRWWRKPLDLGELPTVLAAFREAGIAVQVGYILWHGRQTVEGALDEVQTLHELGIYSHRAACSRLIAFQGCALAQGGATSRGFQPMDESAEAFLRKFEDRARSFSESYIRDLVAEPYETARAYLTGDDRRLRELREALCAADEQSFRLFMVESGSGSSGADR